MSLEAVPEPPDRRSLERRLESVERDFRQMEMQVAVMKATLDGLVSTMDSRHKAFEKGQDLILKGIDALEKIQLKQEGDLKNLAITPPDLSKIVFSPGVVITVIVTILSIVAGQQASTWGMRSDIRDMRTSMSLQADIEKGTQRLQEERATTLKNAVDAIGRKQELQQIQFQELRDEVLGRPRQQR
jgi:hypothetical protein